LHKTALTEAALNKAINAILSKITEAALNQVVLTKALQTEICKIRQLVIFLNKHY
jgi:hypothetical protein